jgi:hypothetical protein
MVVIGLLAGVSAVTEISGLGSENFKSAEN